MNKTNLALLCLGVAVFPVAVMAAINYDKLVVEDRQMGRLLYFTDNT